jgi:hypothetical protein
MKSTIKTFVTVVFILHSIQADEQQDQAKSRHHQTQPIYIDYSGPCPRIYYSSFRVALNCSALNLANNWSILSINTNNYITELLLAANNFQSNLPYDSINKFDSIKVLDLSGNFLNEKTTDLQLIDCSVNYLNEIYLNGNMFAKFPMFSQSCMNLLRVVRLRNNKNLIDLDDPNVFNNPIVANNLARNMPNLRVLDLSYSNIEFINNNNFTLLSKFPSLTYLNLFANRIKMIYENPFIWTPNLIYFNVDQNELECKINLVWMKYFLIKKPLYSIMPNGTQFNTTYFPVCQSLFTQKNQSIITLEDKFFYTEIYLSTNLKQTDNIEVFSGNSIDLDCQQYSVPQSDLWWTFNDRVLSKTVTPDSPYEFIENFNSSMSSFNKSSTLRIKNVKNELAGVYKCGAYYLNRYIDQFKNIKTINFKLNVKENPNARKSSLSGGVIAGIVLASFFLLLFCMFLIFLLCYCCCYKRGRCCFRKSSSSYSSSTSSSTSSSSSANFFKKSYSTKSSNNNMNGKAAYINEFDENASGFKDINRSKPNYVINTISKGSAANLNSNKASQMYPETSSSWRILPNNSEDSGSHDQNQFASKAYFEQDLPDTYNQYSDTMVYNVQNHHLHSNQQDSYNQNYKPIQVQNHNYYHQEPNDRFDSTVEQNVYTIKHPSNYISTNEAFVNDTNILNQFQSPNDIYLSSVHDMRPHDYETYEENKFVSTSKYARSTRYGNDDESIKHPIEIPISRLSANHYNHEDIKSNSLYKYDSDV